MKNFLRKLVDSGDKEVEAHLVLLCCGAVSFILLSLYHVMILKNAFDASLYGQGFGYLFAGGGAAAVGQGMQRKAEKDSKHESDQ